MLVKKYVINLLEFILSLFYIENPIFFPLCSSMLPTIFILALLIFVSKTEIKDVLYFS